MNMFSIWSSVNILFVIMVHKEKKVGKHCYSTWVHVLSFIDMRSDIILAGNVRIVIFLIFWVMYRTIGSEFVVADILEDPTASTLWVEVRSSVSDMLEPTYSSVLWLNSEAASCCVGTMCCLSGDTATSPWGWPRLGLNGTVHIFLHVY